MPSRRANDRANRIDCTAHDVPFSSACTRCRARNLTCRRSTSSARCVACARASAFCLFPFSHMNASRTRAVLRNIRTHVRHVSELLLVLDLDSSSAADDNFSGILPESFDNLSTSPVLSPVPPIVASSATPVSMSVTTAGTSAPDPCAVPSSAVSDNHTANDFPSIDLDSLDWNQFFDLHPNDVPGPVFAFDDLYSGDFNSDLVPSSITESLSSNNSGFLGSGNFLEQTVDPRFL